jgi:ankyrin repeat protein
MKSIALSLCTLLMIMTVVSCGKQAKVDDKNSEKKNQQSKAAIYFNALKEIEKSVLENDLVTLKRVVYENPEVDLNQILHNGETFLIIAIKNDFRLIRDYLIEDKKVLLNHPNVNKETPLIAAVASKNENSVRVLLDLKVDLERRDSNGDTALHVAIKKSLDPIALILIKQGANVEAMDRRERNAYKLSEMYEVPQSRDLIRSILQIETGAPDLAGFRTILVQGDHKRLNQVLSRYPNIAKDQVYEAINPLALLVEVNNETSAMRSAELLINYKANVNGPLDADLTPLIKATVLKKKGFANLYLSNNANPHLYDINGKSALIHAIEMNNLEMVDLLLSFSAVENYSFRKDGKKISFNACKVARATESKLDNDEDKKINQKIKDSLNCGFIRWLF